MTLVDTSAWIEYLRRTESPVNVRLRELIASDAAVATTEPITMEILSGARNGPDERRLRRLLYPRILLPFRGAIDFDGAARIYRLCRRRGVTPRSLVDCMIASVAMRHRAAVLAHDTDFARIASLVALDLDPATPLE